MILNCNNLSEELRKGIILLEKMGYVNVGEDGIQIEATKGNEIIIHKTETSITISYDTTLHFYMALARGIGMKAGRQIIKPKIKDFGLMFDCSRNAVAKPETVKKLIGFLALCGYTYIQLYTEETYELPGEPYFGYQRGRYKVEELREIIQCAEVFGMEVIPCIQTLAHLKNLSMWRPYKPYMDTDRILLVGDERTYELIRKCIRFSKDVFHTKRINIGTDEAFQLGRGKYLDINGYKSKHKIFLEHLKKIFEICKEEDVYPEFWGDAFYDTECTDEEIQSLFDGTQTPIYWDYYRSDEEYHREKLQKLENYAGKVIYAGGVWKWIGFAPENGYSEPIIDAAFKAAESCKVDNIFMTAWGDNGDECSIFAVIPAMWYAVNKIYSVDMDSNILIKEFTGYSMDEWKVCDLLNYVMDDVKDLGNAVRWLLYNDFLIGLLDYHVPNHAGNVYEKFLPIFEEFAERNSNFSYIFKVYAGLCKVLIRKATYGKRLYEAYHNSDIETMKDMQQEVMKIRADLTKFTKTFRDFWMTENKGHGMEVMDVRLGGLISRCDTVYEVLDSYLSGRTKIIYELESERLDYWNGAIEGDANYTPLHNDWATIYTANNL